MSKFKLAEEVRVPLEKKYKKSSVSVITRRLKMVFGNYTECLNLYHINKHISKCIDNVIDSDYTCKKNLLWDMNVVYGLCSNKKPSIVNRLAVEVENSRNQEIKVREQKQKEPVMLKEEFLWDELQKAKNKAKEAYEKSSTISKASDYILMLLYSDETFGPKRAMDIADYPVSIQQIEFKTKKNGFEYKGLIPEEAYNIWSKHFNKGDPLLRNPTNSNQMSSETVRKSLKRITGCSFITVQYIRKLWASYMILKKHTAYDINHQVKELTHSHAMHFNDYVNNLPISPKKLIAIKMRFLAEELQAVD